MRIVRTYPSRSRITCVQQDDGVLVPITGGCRRWWQERDIVDGPQCVWLGHFRLGCGAPIKDVETGISFEVQASQWSSLAAIVARGDVPVRVGSDGLPVVEMHITTRSFGRNGLYIYPVLYNAASDSYEEFSAIHASR